MKFRSRWLLILLLLGSGRANSQEKSRLDDPREILKPHFSVPAEFAGDFGLFRKIPFSPEKGNLWPKKRAEIRAEWMDLLGGEHGELLWPEWYTDQMVAEAKRDSKDRDCGNNGAREFYPAKTQIRMAAESDHNGVSPDPE